jgi:lipopolysaccharide export LptBFGC system permease protein LptF
MTKRDTSVTVAAVLFAIIALLHLLRGIAGWPAVINNVTIPVPVSWIAVIVAGGMAVWLWKS